MPISRSRRSRRYSCSRARMVPVTFLPYRRRQPQDDFPDRLVNVIAAAPEAMAGEHSFELTGGIDRLMGERFETRVFYVTGEGVQASTHTASEPPPAACADAACKGAITPGFGAGTGTPPRPTCLAPCGPAPRSKTPSQILLSGPSNSAILRASKNRS